MEAIANMDGWQVLVVAERRSDHVTHNQWPSMPNMTYLSEEHQSALGFDIYKHTAEGARCVWTTMQCAVCIAQNWECFT
jgi:hypothetical protein